MAALAVLTLDLSKMSAWTMQSTELAEEIGRTVQSHFLRFDIYIPLEDIWLDQEKNEVESQRLSLLMRKVCGHGSLYVWVPVSFRLPFVGTKTVEWCWKPELPVHKSSVTG